MPYDFSINDPGGVTATELVVSIFDQVDSAFYDVRYPEILWREHIPAQSIKTDIAPGAMNHVYRNRDIKGMGQFVNGDPRNIPRVGQSVGQITVPILDAAVGASLTNAEARRYQYGYQSALAQDLGEIMKKASEYHIERVFFFGDLNAGFAAYLDYPTVTKIPSVTWDGASPSVWVETLNDAITAVWTSSKTVHMPDTVEMPPSLFSMLTGAYVIGAGTTGVAVSALEYLKKNNIYTLTTGKELNIKPLRYLEGAGVAGVDRIIVKESDPRNYVMPFPLPHQLAQPVPVALGVEMFAEYIFGSYNVRYPASMAYVDVALPDAS